LSATVRGAAVVRILCSGLPSPSSAAVSVASCVVIRRAPTLRRRTTGFSRASVAACFARTGRYAKISNGAVESRFRRGHVAGHAGLFSLSTSLRHSRIGRLNVVGRKVAVEVLQHRVARGGGLGKRRGRQQRTSEDRSSQVLLHHHATPLLMAPYPDAFRMAPQRSLKTPVALKKSQEFLEFIDENAAIKSTTANQFCNSQQRIEEGAPWVIGRMF